MERVKSVPACPRWRWRERAHAAMRSTNGGGASLCHYATIWVFAAPGLYPRLKANPYVRTERCGRCAGCGMAFVYRPISRPMHISDLTSLVSRPPYKLSCKFYTLSGRVARRLPCARRAARAARCTGTVLAQLRIRHMGLTWGPSSWAPLLWPRGSCGSPHNRMPRVPLALPVASYLSRRAPHCFSRLGPAPRTAAPRGRAPSATRMWSASRPDGPAAGRHAFAHCHGLRVTTGSLPPSSLESASVSVAAVTSTVTYAGAGCT